MKLFHESTLLVLLHFLVCSMIPVRAFSQLNPKDPVKTIEFVVKTSNDIISGTSNEVWFDVGPKAWKWKDGFSRGETITISRFNPDKIDTDVSLVEESVPLLVEDIYQLRIEKKGLSIPFLKKIGGITNAPDDLSELTLAEDIGPKELLPSLSEKVAQAKTLLDQKQALVNIQQGLINDQVNTITAAETVINNTADVVAQLPSELANAQNDLINIQNQLAQTPMKIVNKICESRPKKEWRLLGFLLGFGWVVVGTELICHDEEAINSVWSNLTNSIAGATQSVNNLQAKIQQESILRASAIQSKTTSLAIKATLESQKAILDADYVVTRKALDIAQNGLDEMNDYVTKIMPTLPFNEIPRLNQWKPESVTVKVNGQTLSTFTINTRLKKGKPSWTGYIQNIPNEEKFVKGLRVNPNASTGDKVDSILSRATTPFLKFDNVSGWETGPVDRAEVTGSLVNEPSPGGDAYVSFDLKVERVTVNGKTFELDGAHGINHTRYIRIEHKQVQPNGSEDLRYKSWHKGKRIKVSGVVKRDTDRITYYEIHPDTAKDIKAFNGLFFF